MKIDKCEKLVCKLLNKKKYIVHIKSLKQALNHGLKLKRVHRIIEFNQKAWLKPYTDMNTELRKVASNDFEKDFYKLMNNAVFGKTKTKEKQKDYYSYLNTIRRGNKNAIQKRTLANINVLFNARDNAIKYIEDYSSMILEARKIAREQEGTGLKILTSNQMLKRLPIALARIKAGNNSESLLNEIRQIVYCLYRSKKNY